jgi:hypothetical protein
MKNKAHVWMCGLLSATMAFTSCTNFLEEDPKTFLSPSEYYTTENQIKAAVDGTYDGLDDLLSSDLEIATVHLFNLEYLVGTSYRPRAAGNEQNQFLLLSGLEESNGIIRNFWKATFFPLENCNSVIQNVSATDIISETTFVFLSFYLILLIDRELYLTFECFVYRFCKEKINKRRFFLTAILTASLFCR